MAVFPHDPDSDLDYSFDWSSWLASDETISNANWSVEPSEGAPTVHGFRGVGAVQGVKVTGGAPGSRYRLACRIETDAGRIGERSLSLRVMER